MCFPESKATVTIVIGKPLSAEDASFEASEWINSFSEAGMFAVMGSYFNLEAAADIAGNIASDVNSNFNPLYGKVSQGDVIVTVYKKQIFNNKTIRFYFDADDMQRCYYVKGD